MAYYYAGRSGDSFADATIHADADCCPDPTRPIAEASVDPDHADWCGDCVPLGNDSDSGGEFVSLEPADMIERGECPWCSEYSGDHVAQHAASSHPDEWDGYKS